MWGTLQTLRSSKVDLFLHQQAIDTSTAAGNMLFQILGVFAEFERAMTAAERAARYRARKAAGKPSIVRRARDRRRNCG